MKRKVSGLILLVWGGLIVAHYIFGDSPVGMSASYDAGRLMGFACGIAMTIAGLVLALKSRSPTNWAALKNAARGTGSRPPGPPGPTPDGYPPGYLPPAERIRLGLMAPASGPGSQRSAGRPGTGAGGTLMLVVVVAAAVIGGTSYLVSRIRSSNFGSGPTVCELEAAYRKEIEPRLDTVQSKRRSQLSLREELAIIDEMVRVVGESNDALDRLEPQDPEAGLIKEEMRALLDLSLRLFRGVRGVRTGECSGTCPQKLMRVAEDFVVQGKQFDARIARYCPE